MPDPGRRRKRLVVTLVTVVIGPAVTIVSCLGGITSFAAYMDVHGALAGMRIAAVGAIAVVVIPLGWWIGAVLCDRIERKTHRADLAALNSPRHIAHTPRGTR